MIGIPSPRARTLKSAGKGIGSILLAIALASCSGPALNIDEQIELARQDFVNFELIAARDGFEEALEREPKNAEAAYGHARTLMELNQFEEAVPAFDLALELAPDDPRVHEGLLSTLALGGSLRGRRAWLDRAIESGKVAILAFPDRVELYETVEDAVDDLNQPELWLQILSDLQPRLDKSSVFRIHHLTARLMTARSTGEEEAAAMIEDELRQELAVASAAEAEAAGNGAESNASRQYFLAAGHDLLGDAETQRSWLARLDETPEGRRMAANMVHFDVYYMDWFDTREAPLEERLEIIERWKQRFHPTWETGDIGAYRIPLSLELGLLINEAERQRDDGRPRDEILDRIIETGRDLIRIDTWGAANEYRWITRTLIDFDVMLAEALGFADEAIVALNEERPGLIYPGVRLDQLEHSRKNWIASFEYLRGLTLAGLERDDEADRAFRKAVDVKPNSERLAALGELLAKRRLDQEAYKTLIAALAHNAEDERLGDEAGRIREIAIEVGTRMDSDEATLDAHLEVANAEVAESERRRLVDDRLDREAPDFNLTDTEGNEWRLSDLRGKVVLLNYWATWCGPCRQEFPHYRDLVNSYASAKDVEFLAINTDNDHSEARDFLEEHDYRFTVLFDEGSATDFHVTGIPAHFILGPEGRIQYFASGFPGAEHYNKEMRWRIEALRETQEQSSKGPL